MRESGFALFVNAELWYWSIRACATDYASVCISLVLSTASIAHAGAGRLHAVFFIFRGMVFLTPRRQENCHMIAF
jgi:hypothetical protein